jgi:RNA polymerase sigma factor (sigma-70 family)
MEDRMTNLGELVRRAQGGDIGSYEDIVIRFQASAFSQAFSVLGDSHLAEDAVQDAFVEAYRKLGSLRTPEAFASWFHRIVFTACSRMKRRRTVLTSSLEEAEGIADPSESPADRLEREQREQTVHLAIQALPDSLRTVTALYYIGGIGQRRIADYLGLPETTVKKRLFDARKKLKEDITNMAKTISEGRMPADQVSARVIAEVVSRPQPLLIKDHPIRQVLDQIKTVMPDYEVIDSREVEEKEIYASIQEPYSAGTADAYQLDAKHVLRTQTSGATLRAIKGRKPPIRLLTAGRVFRAVQEDDRHLKVFHQLGGICVAPDASAGELRETLKRLISAVLGQVEIRFRDEDYGWVDQGMEVDAKVNDKWESVGGCGMLKPEMLREAGHNPKRVQGYAFGLGLERLALLKSGLKSIHELWRPPYLQPGP